MKVFQSLQENMLILGLERPMLDKKHQIKLKTFVILIFMVKFVFCLTLGFFSEAITFSEYADLVQIILSSFGGSMIYLVFIINMNEVFKLINNFEIMIETRKFYLYLELGTFLYLELRIF